ncbi:hypothetical protein ABB37_09253 [Leptomonas pyrrhocoris]|uniref:Protein dpy-30 homolog n=1 Tax=Leptomonas pyrrhocoris TaxID=157538 RepID=A0A0M9FR44_LEPPY|nr:hypothetical protein ABB37_09253 [Leptomonas pyrrhocoris]KPA74239.1 hypothetical protein ABB37_09253 [Leptomonas pyrrhocoris]|eukprot:XP_015652678.1 hypothetical protein ABB37_09253 [Leptomonas pyrrhocoris]
MSTAAAAPAVPAGEPKDAAAVAPTASDSLLPPRTASNTSSDDADSAVSAQTYLEKTVMGVLALGLEDVCRVRPTNPVDYLGSYLLRRSTANNTVEVTYEDTLPKPVHVDGEDA